jgi:hypothetical protein
LSARTAGPGPGFLGRLWLAYALYAGLAGWAFQKLLLPQFAPALGRGGLLAGDAQYFHEAALALARRLGEQGWHAWSAWPAPGATGNVAVLGALYHLFGPQPALAIPVNAVLHASAAILLVRLAVLLLPGAAGRRAGILAASAFVVFPSSLNWVGQVHKDGYAILGLLLIVHALSRALARLAAPPSGGRGSAAGEVLVLLAGMALIVFVRAYLLPLAALLVLIALVLGLVVRRRLVGCALPALLAAALLWQSGLLEDPGRNALPLALVNAGAAEPCPEAGEPAWRWHATTGLPQGLDQGLARLAALRARFMRCGLAVSAGSMIDPDRPLPDRAGALLALLPRTTQVALFAPFPDRWLAGRTPARIVGAAETLAWYLAAPGIVLLAFCRPGLPALFVGLSALAGLALEGLVTPNLGTLYRIRYPEMALLLTLGVTGWAAWRGRRARPRAGLSARAAA